MHPLSWASLLSALLIGGMAEPVVACSLVVQTPGLLRASADNTVLGSQVDANTPATLTSVLPLLRGVTVDVGAPTLLSAPGGYNSTSQTLEVAYSASVIGLIDITSQPYTTSPTSFTTGLLGAVTMTLVMHNRVLNPSGFAPGNYSTRTVVTCHP